MDYKWLLIAALTAGSMWNGAGNAQGMNLREDTDYARAIANPASHHAGGMHQGGGMNRGGGVHQGGNVHRDGGGNRQGGGSKGNYNRGGRGGGGGNTWWKTRGFRGDVRYGRTWYLSNQNRFFAPNFVWVTNGYYLGLLTDLNLQLATFGAPAVALAPDISALIAVLQQQNQNLVLANVQIQHQLVDLMGKISNAVPDFNVEQVFEPNGPPAGMGMPNNGAPPQP